MLHTESASGGYIFLLDKPKLKAKSWCILAGGCAHEVRIPQMKILQTGRDVLRLKSPKPILG
eukprot:10005277-Ditylum_brightwellii.AAC.1